MQDRLMTHGLRGSLFFCLLLLVSASIANAQEIGEEDLARLDETVTRFMSEHNVPGLLYALAADGEVQIIRTHGLADVELSVPVTEESVFEIGSISKQFVAAVVMMLIEDGKLALEDPIQTILPDIPSDWFGVTVKQLLTHTSGIPDYEEIASYDVYRTRLTPEEVLRIAHSRPVDFAPGTGFHYSNTGYFLLSRIVEMLDGKPLGKILKSRIFDLLGMTSTRMADPEAIIPHRVSGYWVDRQGELINRPSTETSSTLGAGGLVSSAADMARWAEALDGTELLSEKSKELMWTPVSLDNGEQPRWSGGDPAFYGFGWNVAPHHGVARQAHSGQVAGFRAFFARYPVQDVAVIIFLNRYQAPVWPIFDEITEILVPEVSGKR